MIIRLFVNILFRLWFKSLWRNAPSIVTVRRRFALADRIGAIDRIDTKVEKEKIDGVDIEWVGSVSSASQGMIFYVHGGSFSVRAPLSDRRFCADLSRRTGLPVVLVAYKLAPEFQFPAGLDDCCHVYELLLQRGVASNRSSRAFRWRKFGTRNDDESTPTGASSTCRGSVAISRDRLYCQWFFDTEECKTGCVYGTQYLALGGCNLFKSRVVNSS